MKPPWDRSKLTGKEVNSALMKICRKFHIDKCHLRNNVVDPQAAPVPMRESCSNIANSKVHCDMVYICEPAT